jgi:plasmid maintenance system antidote protein VapI
MTDKEIGRRLQSLIEAEGMTIKSFAERIGYLPESIGKFCCGAYSLPAPAIIIISKALGTTPNKLLGFDGNL